MKQVIMILSFFTKEAEYNNQEKPRFSWINPKGEMLGIWEKEWGDIMLKRLVTHYPDYDCEIWQPELRADKEYSARLHDRLIHRKFPARLGKRISRFKIFREVRSKDILNKVRKYDERDTTFLLPAAVYGKMMKETIRRIKNARVVYYNLLNNSVLLPSSPQTMNPLKAVNRILINIEKRRWLGRMNVLLTPSTNPQAISQLKGKYPNITVCELRWGLDQDFWQRAISKETAREILGIENSSFVIVLSQRLVPEYQVDKFLEAVAGVITEKVFSCYITGHGAKEYENRLKKMVNVLGLEDKVSFLGFISDEDLRNYLIAADLFATFPLMSAGSGGALKAMAVGTPVLLTTSCGESYNFLREHNAGAYVEPKDYAEWSRRLTSLVEGEGIQRIDREEVLSRYNSKFTAASIDLALKQGS